MDSNLATRDTNIRSAMRVQLNKRYVGSTNTMIIEELGLCHGWSRIDFAVIDGKLHGYEIKSDKDTLARLPAQIETYCAVLDQVTIVVGRQHISPVLDLVPEWWGIVQAKMRPDETVALLEVREPEDNPNLDLRKLTKLLWSEEAMRLLDHLGAAKGCRSKSRTNLYDRLVKVADPAWLKAAIYSQLRCRTDWRSDAQRM